MLWDSSIATIRFSQDIRHLQWSPCTQFVAVLLQETEEIHILDAVTLKRLNVFIPPFHSDSAVFFFGSHLLTWAGSKTFITWDLQTGVQVGKIFVQMEDFSLGSITYSGCGTMFGVLFTDGSEGNAVINTYNALLSTLIYSHPIGWLENEIIWTDGQCLQFATFEPGLITIWEVGFASKHPPTKVKSVPAPDNFDLPERAIFLPAHFQLAFVDEGKVSVWDAQHSRFLLTSVDIISADSIAFSPNGYFFTCTTDVQEVSLWKESPTGYVLHCKLACTQIIYELSICPNGQSIIGSASSTLYLWHIPDSTTSSISPAQSVQTDSQIVLGFSPDGLLAAAAELRSNIARVLDLKSGVTQLVIDAGMEIYDLGIVGTTITVVGNGKIITWNLSAGNDISNDRVDIGNSIQTITFNQPQIFQDEDLHRASISPNLNHIVVSVISLGISDWYLEGFHNYHLHIFEVPTGKYVGCSSTEGTKWWFNPDGSKVLEYSLFGHLSITIITKGIESNTEEDSDETKRPPWQSPHGHQVMDNGWILSSSGKRLFLLPPHLQLNREDRIWGGQYLAFLRGVFPEVLILEV